MKEITKAPIAPREIDLSATKLASGGAETVHLYLKSSGEDIQGESTSATGERTRMKTFLSPTGLRA